MPRPSGLAEAIKSIGDYLTQKNLKDVVLFGHSYGGMVITGVADQVPERIRRLVYWNAFVPNNGESLNDMVPPPYVALFDQSRRNAATARWCCRSRSGARLSSTMPMLATAQKAYDILNPHPVRDLLRQDRAEDQSGGYADRQSPTSTAPKTRRCRITIRWHPRLSQKLGLFRLVQVPGSHELCFSNPKLLAQAIMDAGRD